MLLFFWEWGRVKLFINLLSCSFLFCSKRGFDVRSFGTGSHVKLPGPAPDKPNVYDFKTTYEQMYNDLVRKDKELYPHLTHLFHTHLTRIRTRRQNSKHGPCGCELIRCQSMLEHRSRWVCQSSAGFKKKKKSVTLLLNLYNTGWRSPCSTTAEQ